MDKNRVNNNRANQTEKMVFRSRISIFLILFLLAIFLVVSIDSIQNKQYYEIYILGALFPALLFLLTGIRYIIADDKLYIKYCGISGGSIYIRSIRSVKRSYIVLSSPAASLKRMALYSQGKSKFPHMLISPVKEKEFVDELLRINPRIKVSIPSKKGIWRFWDWDI